MQIICAVTAWLILFELFPFIIMYDFCIQVGLYIELLSQFCWSNVMLCLYDADPLAICMKKFYCDIVMFDKMAKRTCF